jgi:hypothetical protein
MYMHLHWGAPSQQTRTSLTQHWPLAATELLLRLQLLMRQSEQCLFRVCTVFPIAQHQATVLTQLPTLTSKAVPNMHAMHALLSLERACAQTSGGVPRALHKRAAHA